MSKWTCSGHAFPGNNYFWTAIDEGTYRTAIVYGNTKDDCDANARLIASAPTMAEDLAEALRIIESLVPFASSHSERLDDEAEDDFDQDWAAKTDAVIRRAHEFLLAKHKATA